MRNAVRTLAGAGATVPALLAFLRGGGGGGWSSVRSVSGLLLSPSTPPPLRTGAGRQRGDYYAPSAQGGGGGGRGCMYLLPPESGGNSHWCAAKRRRRRRTRTRRLYQLRDDGSEEGWLEGVLDWRDDLSTRFPLAPPDGDGGGGCVRDVSFLSWNILAQIFAEKDYARLSTYPGKKPLAAPEPWEIRAEKILTEILSSQSDVVCLQEVSLGSYHADLLPAMESAGYEGTVQDNKKSEHVVATFWRRERFVLVGRSSRSRTMTAVLRDTAAGTGGGGGGGEGGGTDDRLLAIANCHLEGHPLKSVARVTQLSHTLAEVRAQHSHHGLVLCGDFNCELHASACGAYLTHGTCPEEGVTEWGRAVPREVADVPGHVYDLASAYPPALGRDDRFGHYTYARLPGRPVAGLDQIWHTPGPLSRVALRRLFPSDGRRRSMLETGLPSPAHPSDHVAIGCVLRWEGSAGGGEPPLPDLRGPAEDDEEGRIAIGGMTPREIMDEAERLLGTVPFADDEDGRRRRREFEYVISEVPGVPAQGRPTEEQLAQLQDRRERRERLLAEVPEAERKVLKRILKLRREATQRSRHAGITSRKE